MFSCRSRHTIWPRDWSSVVCSSDLKTYIIKPSLPGYFGNRRCQGLGRDRFDQKVLGALAHAPYPIGLLIFGSDDNHRNVRSEERRVGKEGRQRGWRSERTEEQEREMIH